MRWSLYVTKLYIIISVHVMNICWKLNLTDLLLSQIENMISREIKYDGTTL